MTCLDRSRGVNSYGALGTPNGPLTRDVAYAKQRKTFGKAHHRPPDGAGTAGGYGDPDHRRPGPCCGTALGWWTRESTT